jgi:uncharacterized protein YqhQ
LQAIGGQAVIEGVMFKSRRGWTVAVRDPKGEIQVKKESLNQRKIEKVPLIRGFFILFYTLILGIKALEYSARMAGEDEKPINPLMLWATLALSFVIGIAIFLFLPLYVTKLLGYAFSSVSESGLLFNLLDGFIRVFIFLIYVWGIGLWKDMARIFEYHGAEHKVIHAHEAGNISMQSIKAQSPRHPRCGTSFLLIVMTISILVFSFIPQAWPFWAKFASRLVFIPLIAGLSYEVLRGSARLEKKYPAMKVIVIPGLALQRLTTREPDEKQLEVALKALNEVLAMESVP